MPFPKIPHSRSSVYILSIINLIIAHRSELLKINELWNSTNEDDWLKALDTYWEYVKPENLEVENEMENLDVEYVKGFDELGWYNFLLKKYFKWKYTAKNRYATTTNSLKQYKNENKLDELFKAKEKIFSFNPKDIKAGLSITKDILGLGVAGFSGLLSLLFPEHFGTVDQFIVKALRQVPDLPEKKLLLKMKPESLSINQGVILIQIMRRKSDELNIKFNSIWTPRKIDKILWVLRE